jgi:hypothetical protein
MKYTKQAEKLEKFLEDEFKNNIKLVVVSKDVVIYKNFKITKIANGWQLSYNSGDKIADFKLKACAALAAKFYDINSMQRINEIKALDLGYWTNYTDSTIFKIRAENASTLEKRELYYCRWDITRHRALKYKQEISQMFKQSF